MKKIVFILTLFIALAGCEESETPGGKQLRISAASSLTDAMESIQTEYQKEHPDTALVFNYGSSSKLRNQIQQGAPVDVFLSASEEDMDTLTEEGLISAETAVPFAGNRLVIATGSDLEMDGGLAQLLSIGETIAIGEPESVPLGKYTKELFVDQGLWQALEGKTVYAKDARQVLSYVESGNADLGIVYFSDAVASDSITIISELQEGGRPIVYPAGIAAASENQQEAEAFLSFLTGKAGQQILEEYGFRPADGGAS